MQPAKGPIQLTTLTNDFRVHFTGATITLPTDLQHTIAAYWQTVIAERPNLFNGPVYTVTGITETDTAMTVDMAQSTFAHYAYCETHDVAEYDFRVLHSAALVITSDNKIIVGQMADHTSRGGAICCSGGAIDPDDIQDGIINLDRNTRRELHEELGIDAANATQVISFEPAYLKTGGVRGKISAIYRVELALSAADFTQHYDQFVADSTAGGEPAEFSKLYFIDATPQAVEAFIAEHETQLDEYLAITLRACAAPS